MLICTKRWREPDEKSSRFLVYDTDDGVQEECSVADIKNAYKQGFKIFGVVYNDNGSINTDTSIMTYMEEYRYHNGENLHIGVRYIKVHDEEDGLILLECADNVNQNYKRYGIVYNGIFLGFNNAIPRLDPKWKISYVDLGSIYVTLVDNKPLVSICYTYYDKHYYREDRGEYFSKYHLFWGSRTIAETDWAKDYLDNRLPSSLDSPKFNWCKKEINLNIWK